MLTGAEPFVLFDDAATGRARLYRAPVETIGAATLDEVEPLLERMRGATARGLHGAGFLGYEAGHWAEPKLRAVAHPHPGPLAWWGLFESVEHVADAAALLPPSEAAFAGPPRPLLERAEYLARVEAALELIRAGEIYQANLTFPCEVPVSGDPLALYARLRAGGRGRWEGAIWTGETWLLSASPELFFTLEEGVVTARPMKGTAPRHRGPREDAREVAALAADPKQRAENLMITDLLRNDLSRIAEPGSVAVPRLHEVETYPTVHQMTSTVNARLRDGLDAVDVLRAAFPSGSVTGAPKIRAMQAIAELENAPRGAYTGSMGWIAPRGDAAFNVLIRTLAWDGAAPQARLHLGSAVVADSDPAAEWDECLAKGAFVTRGVRAPDLFETMRFEPEAGVVDLSRHLARMRASADALGYVFDRHGARNELQAATFRLTAPALIRLRLSPGGALAIGVSALPPPLPEPVPVAAVPLPTTSDDYRLRHKTADRRPYETALSVAGTPEAVLVRPDGLITEGTYTSIFVARGERLVTPSLRADLLPGVLRSRLLEEGRAEEADLTLDDLSEGFLIGNAVRGLLAAVLVATDGGP